MIKENGYEMTSHKKTALSYIILQLLTSFFFLLNFLYRQLLSTQCGGKYLNYLDKKRTKAFPKYAFQYRRPMLYP